jgi:hypothetical protein
MPIPMAMMSGAYAQVKIAGAADQQNAITISEKPQATFMVEEDKPSPRGSANGL